MKALLTTTLFLLTTLLLSCDTKEKKPTTKKKQNVRTATCSSFWAEYAPEASVKIKIIQDILDGEHDLSSENIRFLKNLKKSFNRSFHPDTLLSTLDQPIYPIYRLKKDQIGILGFYRSENINGPWEDITTENMALQENYGYQSFDSVGKLCHFPEEFSEMYNDAPPSINIYSISKKGKSRIKNLAYLGDDCLSYFQYDFSLSEKNSKDSILFGSKYSLDIEFGSYPEINQKFKTQFADGCMDCPTNYPDQVTFAKLNGVDNIYFSFADEFPLNTKLATPSRSIVYIDEKGKVITLWTVELDLSGCGCR